jgi:hypothetical protein
LLAGSIEETIVMIVQKQAGTSREQVSLDLSYSVDPVDRVFATRSGVDSSNALLAAQTVGTGTSVRP